MKTMMKIVAVVMIVLMMAGTALAAGQIRTSGNVNVRTGAGTDYTSKGTVKAGTVLKFDETHKDARGVIWYHVTSGSKGGWISSKYANVVSDSKAAEKAATVKITGEKVNARKGAGLGYDVVATVKAGKVLKYEGESKKDSRGVTWYKVSGGGRTGWVSSKYAVLQK